MAEITTILDLIIASGPQGGAMPPEQRAVRVWAVELVRERWGLYATPQQMINAAWLVQQYASGAALPVTNPGTALAAIDVTKLPVPSAGLPTSSYPPPTTP